MLDFTSFFYIWFLGFHWKLAKQIFPNVFPTNAGNFTCLAGFFSLMLEILHACRESGRNGVQAGDSLSMRESWKPCDLSMFQKLRHSNTCNEDKSCTKYGWPDQSQRKLTVALTTIIVLIHGEPSNEKNKTKQNKNKPKTKNKNKNKNKTKQKTKKKQKQKQNSRYFSHIQSILAIIVLMHGEPGNGNTHLTFHIFNVFNHRKSHETRARKRKNHVTFHIFKAFNHPIALIHGQPRNGKLTLLFTYSKYSTTIVLIHREPRNGKLALLFT